MQDNSLRVLRGKDIFQLLAGRESEIIATVRRAYSLHGAGKSSLPHSIFLRFPDRPSDRIIGLPAYLKTDEEIAGMKWIASFPGNVQLGIERASATLILNDMQTGRPYCLMEASLISAARTAASAALTASLLAVKRAAYQKMAIVGCGPINEKILTYITALSPSIDSLLIYDIDPERAADFADSAHQSENIAKVLVCGSLEEATSAADLISIATNATQPYINDMSIFQNDAVVLHVSLRDFTAQAILSSVNIVDDVDHVNRENTSIHLASSQIGHTNFISGTITDLLADKDISMLKAPVIFSPFGLGILDIAVADVLHKMAVEQDMGVLIPDFFESGAMGA